MSDTYSEEYRAECEARYVASLEMREPIEKYLAGVKAKRGADDERLLRSLVWDILHPHILSP